MKIALDATYSVGPHLSGVGVYSRELLHALREGHPDIDWRWLYRVHRLRASFGEALPPEVRRGILLDQAPFRNPGLFHGLNQRLPHTRYKRQVVTFHDLFVMTAEYSTPDFRARFTQQARHAAETADHIIAVSHFTASQVIDLLHVDPARVSVVPHGVRVLPRLNLPRENIVLHVGAIQKRKNLVRLVRAFEQAMPKDWRLVLAGSNGFGAEEVFAAIQATLCAERIEVTGYVDANSLAHWYSKASVFAFPSLDEGFGMPVLEAMAAGIPTIASRTSAVGEVAGDAGITIDPESEDELAAALRILSQDTTLRDALIQRGIERASQYTWQAAASKTWDVYRRLWPALP